MTRKSVVARDAKRQKTVERYAVKRAALKKEFLNPENSYEEKMAAFEKLQKLPRNASPFKGYKKMLFDWKTACCV